uniref:Uncharacterized protein n=1 Tax=Oryza meridionalis TaxID=40149 RepID=A0A0E0D045_9ORYZ
MKRLSVFGSPLLGRNNQPATAATPTPRTHARTRPWKSRRLASPHPLDLAGFRRSVDLAASSSSSSSSSSRESPSPLQDSNREAAEKLALVVEWFD